MTTQYTGAHDGHKHPLGWLIANMHSTLALTPRSSTSSVFLRLLRMDSPSSNLFFRRPRYHSVHTEDELSVPVALPPLACCEWWEWECCEWCEE